MLSKRIRNQAPLLKQLSKAKPNFAKAVIKAANKDLLDSLAECSLNVLKGTVPLSPCQKKRLQRHKHCLRQVSNKRVSRERKRKVLQTGGFLASLLSPIVGILGSLLGS